MCLPDAAPLCSECHTVKTMNRKGICYRCLNRAIQAPLSQEPRSGDRRFKHNKKAAGRSLVVSKPVQEGEIDARISKLTPEAQAYLIRWRNNH